MAEAHNLDFNKAEATARSINAWCSEKSNNKIQSIVDESVVKTSKMILVSTVYFKAAWASAFDKLSTKDEEFTTAAGNRVNVKMMHQRNVFGYFRGDNFQSIALRYLQGNQTMFVFLPNRNVSLSSFLGAFDARKFKTWQHGYDGQSVQLSLPRFKIEYSINLKPALHEMGMRSAFGPAANFSNMSNTATYISYVVQKTFMNVDELGTEAAATTEVVGEALSFHPHIIDFRVDRPFAIALVDDRTGDIVFMGAIYKPS
jgi:serpin B